MAATGVTSDMAGPFDLPSATPQNGAHSQAANTPIVICLPPTANKYTRLWGFRYRPGATLHNVYYMVPIGNMQTTVLNAAAVGATSLVTPIPLVDGAGLVVANTDYLVVQYADETFDALLCGGSSGGVTLTVPALTKSVLAGSPIWLVGTPGTTDHPLRKAIAQASEPLSLFGSKAGVVTTPQKFQPIVLYSDNPTNAGNFDHIEATPVKFRTS